MLRFVAVSAGLLFSTILGACSADSNPPAGGAGESSPKPDGAVGADVGTGTGTGGGAGVGGAGGSIGQAGSALGGGAAGSSDVDAARGDGSDATVSDQSSTPRTGTGCVGLLLCDDFEGAAAGGPPKPSLWKVGAPNGTGTGTVAIDATVAHGGKNSVKVTGKGPYNNHIFFYNDTLVAGIGRVLFGRMFVRFESAFGMAHTTFVAMKDGVGKDLRIGGQSEILMWNRESDDATLPALSPVGIGKSVKPTPGTWHCLEFRVDGQSGEIETWVDDKAADGLRVDTTPTADVDEPWLRGGGYKPTLSDVRFGWEAYGGGDMNLWFDDVALSGQRIGCQ